MKKHINRNKEEIYKRMMSLSDAQKQGIEAMLRGETDDKPEDFVRRMNYGGEYSIDDDLKMVEMNGDFSRSDLLKIAAIMVD